MMYESAFGANSAINFSPPFATQEDCQKVRAEFGYQRGVCVQIKELVK